MTGNRGHLASRLSLNTRGSASLELTLLVPVVILIALAMVAAWRISSAKAQVRAAAGAGARAASMEQSGVSANQAGELAASMSMKNSELPCTPSIEIDTSGFQIPVGSQAQVSATVVCELNLSDLALPGLPGSMTITQTAYQPLDSYRSREP